MKKLFLLISVCMIFFSACKKLTGINTDPSKFKTAEPAGLMQGCYVAMASVMANHNITRFWDEAHLVRLGGRNNNDDANIWASVYIQVLQNLQQIKTQFEGNPAYTNRVQIARIWESFAYYYLVANYGPVAKTQANNLDYQNNIIYDDEDTVYRQLLGTLKDAVSKIDVNNTKDKLSYDIIYGGDLTKWIKFGNTLRLEIALTCRRNLGSYAEDNIRDVMNDESNTISAEAETAKMPYENTTGNQNPYYTYFKLNTYNSQNIPSMSDFLFLYFRSYQDPRINAYFDSVPLANRITITDTLSSTTDDTIRVVTYPIPHLGWPQSPGFLSGWTNLLNVSNPVSGATYMSYSRLKGYGYGSQTDPIPDNSIVSPTHPFIFLSYAQSEFLKAEAAYLNLGGSKTAEEYYDEGITANFNYWGLSGDQLNQYMQTDGIKWNTKGTGFYNYIGIVNADIPEDNIYKIWVQSWINFYPDQGFEAWTLQRRTRSLDFPPLTNPGGNVGSATYADITARTMYPVITRQLNPTGYADALNKLGITSNDDSYIYVPLKFMVPSTVKNWNAANAHYDMSYVRKWYGSTIQDLEAAKVSYQVLDKIY